ncbi:helix-turn-helix transcriptional regulator [Curtobacterium sp. 9128]|uniref:helix-turn-helix transcriptional regulator n=1 Tax=Curtobacterium sp. 9128 TaxID=1793722 RepID=UPI0011A82E29|nr:helix-turn-helix transcriptional regulator [Curtobacterium sp. 9128]
MSTDRAGHAAESDHRAAPTPLVSVAGVETDGAITDLAGMYAGRRWYSRHLADDYWYRYVAIGDADLSVRRSQMHGYLRGDVAVEGEVVVQWIDSGTARIEVGQNEKHLQLGVPTLFPVEQRFEMEYQDWDQRLVHISRTLLLDVAAERYLVTGAVTFDREVSPPPAAITAWREAVAAAVAAFRGAGPTSLAWHEAKRDVARRLLDLYRFRAEPITDAFAAAGNVRLRAAVDFVHAHAAENLTVQEIAAACGLSVRGVQEAFHRVLDTTPMNYLREVRMQAARDALRAGRVGETSVGEVARGWGFVHLGRFAVQYRERFGESPRETLAAE